MGKVLIVDDDPATLMLMTRVLQEAGIPAYDSRGRPRRSRGTVPGHPQRGTV